jgi:hypothetical protein|tara:strand:- start:259 stop:438 length:180 start_codon:yes stop_codon:yes gene_type:complete
MGIDVYYKNVYGNDLCYPACYDAVVFTELLGQKTLSAYALARIKSLGYKVNVVAYNPTA